jgi:hypothetical protein
MTKSARIAFLGFVFSGLLMIYLWQQYLASFPRKPRLIFQNDGLADIVRLIVQTASRKIDMGRVPAGGTVVLPIEPEAGEIYLIDGNEFTSFEMIHYLTLAGQARTDVHLGIDEDGCGWIEDDRTLHPAGYPNKRMVTPDDPATGGSY